MNKHILIVDDDNGHRLMLEALLKKWKFQTSSAIDGVQALEMSKEFPYDAILMDIRMPNMDGMTALMEIHYYNPVIPIIMMTAFSDIANAVEAVKNGAYDYLTKPLDFDRLKITLNNCLEHAQLKQDVEKLKNSSSINIIGSSPVIESMKELISTVAPSEATVLILGRSGTGKELVAQSIHEQSLRSKKSFVAINCAALTESLLESELFGHEKGAFTGADKKRDGRFVQANGGTIFLDEIGEISPLMQVKLLRVLQQKEIQRVGSDETFKVDVRIIAATNRNLEEEIAKGNFREDLYYRLNVVTIPVPALCERTGDIPLLAQFFMQKFCGQNNKEIKGFSPQTMDYLVKYNWPGNVRELENTIERAVILSRNEFIQIEVLPPSIINQATAAPIIQAQSLEELERNFILQTLQSVNDNKSEAAKLLGISRKTLHTKIKQYEQD